MWSLSVYTGIRPGELCALGWEDIDLKAGTMMIRRNLAQDKFTVPRLRQERTGLYTLSNLQSKR
jgi:integrase